MTSFHSRVGLTRIRCALEQPALEMELAIPQRSIAFVNRWWFWRLA